MAGFLDSKETEWRPTIAILEKIRSEGFDTSGLRNLKKMLKCIAKHEQKIANQAEDCKLSLEKIWNKCKDDPFIDDFGTNVIKGSQSYSRRFSAHSKAARETRGPIDHIKQILNDADDNLKELLHSKFDLHLIFLIKQRKEILNEIVLCKQEYHNSCRAVLNQLRHRGVSNHLEAERKIRACDEYKNILQIEKEERSEFIDLCREAKSTIMRHELCLFLNRKDAYSMAADWLEKTSLVKAQGGDADGMVEFLRQNADVMNSRQFVEGWKRLHCEEIVMPKFVPHDVNKDFKKHIPLDEQRTLPDQCRQNGDARKVDDDYMFYNAGSSKQNGNKTNPQEHVVDKIVVVPDSDKKVIRDTLEKGAGEQRTGAKTKKKLKMMLTMQI